MNPAFSAPSVTPNATHAFGGIWRLTIRRFYSPMRWLTLAGMLAVLAVFSIPIAPTREAAAHSLIPWAARFYLCFLAPILAFISAAGVMRDDLKADSADYVFTRPVRRPAFVIFRFLAHVTCTQVDFLLALAVVIGIGIYHGVPDLWSAVPILLLAQVVVIVAFSAFGFLSGMLTSRYVIIGLIYGGIVEIGIGNVPTQLNRLSMIRQVLGILHPIIRADQGGIGGPAMVPTLTSPAIVALLLAFSVAMLAVTALVFALRELPGSSARET